MHYETRKSRWRDRWHVYEMGRLEGDWTWRASFASLASAQAWASGPK